MKFALVLVAALVGATASKGCSSKMKVTYYDDMYCQTVDDEGSHSVEGWDDGECEKTMSTKTTILGNAPLSVSRKTFFLMTNVELSNLILSMSGTAATAHWTDNIS